MHAHLKIHACCLKNDPTYKIIYIIFYISKLSIGTCHHWNGREQAKEPDLSEKFVGNPGLCIWILPAYYTYIGIAKHAKEKHNQINFFIDLDDNKVQFLIQASNFMSNACSSSA